MKYRTNQTGFSHVMVGLSLVLVAIIGFAGYRVMKHQQDTSTDTKSSVQSTVQLPAKISTKPQAQQAAKVLDKEAIDTSLDSAQLDKDLNSVL